MFKPQSPSLYVQNDGEDLSTKVALSLTRAQKRFVVRLTGGCGYMSAQDAEGLYSLFTHAFDGYRGAVLCGGTQMLTKDNPKVVVPGITEIAPRIREQNEGSVVLGIVPRTGELKLTQHGMVVDSDAGEDYFTIIHPQQDMCMVVQHSVDTGVSWDAEYLFSQQVIESLVEFSGWKHLLVAYNGGSVTEKEVLLWAQRAWPVVLVAGSGRTCDKLAGDKDFLRENPSVMVVSKTAIALRTKLRELGAIDATPPRLAVVG
jgi:hypothetical protein